VPYSATSISTTTDCIYTSFLQALLSPQSVVLRLCECLPKSAMIYCGRAASGGASRSARPLERTTVMQNVEEGRIMDPPRCQEGSVISMSMTLPYLTSGPLQWARRGCGADTPPLAARPQSVFSLRPFSYMCVMCHLGLKTAAARLL